uniref:Uncharacterized protein n=1 Tax=Chromera velia CCMP2878 TaxID=1169474 RepID=A0A0G4FA40_9ALVE|eukprot:Cvel_15957.t1-p1 / transcript=Cvel_15957.t1 / gene=Cvel_15957 / organism=Chromera_velia_CCMP2878 / gene_product=hypothetical protein / transcript_product=hypothetical protein / location=Cvel_scaffold1207:21026-21292(+) / protein_length=89 / sequence_SO=supercontig / SO=protein_coding / is_pseudo=false
MGEDHMTPSPEGSGLDMDQQAWRKRLDERPHHRHDYCEEFVKEDQRVSAPGIDLCPESMGPDAYVEGRTDLAPEREPPTSKDGILTWGM